MLTDGALKIVAVGDLSLNGAYHQLLSERGPAYPFRRVCRQWQNAALRFGNLESPISSTDRVAPAKLTLRGAPLTCESLVAAGFDCVCLANNHMMDFGSRGLLETVERLNGAGIAHVGAGRNLAEAMRPVIFRRQGRSVGVLAFCDVEQISDLYATPTSPGVARADLAACREAIGRLRQEADWVIVHMHWGAEMSRLPSPLQRRWAEILTGAGADVIIGHHPHVLQPIEQVRGAAVAYSLGDFLFSSMFWHGVNGSGKPFIAHYEVHPLSRRTGWLEVDLASGRAPVAHFRPAYLKRDLHVAPHETFSRRREWRQLNRLLERPNYQEVFGAEATHAASRGCWRMSGRRPLLRIWIKLLEYGCCPKASVEPDGADWRASYCRSS